MNIPSLAIHEYRYNHTPIDTEFLKYICAIEAQNKEQILEPTNDHNRYLIVFKKDGKSQGYLFNILLYLNKLNQLPESTKTIYSKKIDLANICSEKSLPYFIAIFRNLGDKHGINLLSGTTITFHNPLVAKQIEDIFLEFSEEI
ncbi:hypothetical protein UFOVP1_11 [uncultured Caudovirales phage]|uniref:Uncharacterized protein n=1 Tax=uncultured Caudovirales phage TaxID=2100421 RepID=A0A6J5KHL1_9CAUD|nr:hypothetical protein UFOVP1_11 [uncultured Caudovirales phage]